MGAGIFSDVNSLLATPPGMVFDVQDLTFAFWPFCSNSNS